MRVVARIRTDFPDKFGIPRQSGLAEKLKGTIVFEPEYRNADAVRGIEEFSHLWIIWGFDKVQRDGWSPTVRPPRLGGNKRVGVFATRSPFRPNPIGLSAVKLEGVEETEKYGIVLKVSGIDMADNTPIYDIKPYLAYADSYPTAQNGFAEDGMNYFLDVVIDEEYKKLIPPEKAEALSAVLAQDPRPSYQNDKDRVYKMCFANMEVSFKVDNTVLTVCGIDYTDQCII